MVELLEQFSDSSLIPRPSSLFFDSIPLLCRVRATRERVFDDAPLRLREFGRQRFGGEPADAVDLHALRRGSFARAQAAAKVYLQLRGAAERAHAKEFGGFEFNAHLLAQLAPEIFERLLARLHKTARN